jgi:RimJ/RimL family protein N-acetyltransferase
MHARYSIAREPFTLDIYGLQLACLPADAPLPDHPLNLYWVARAADGQAVAFIIMYQYNDCWYLSRAGTLDGHAGQGLYPRLLRTAFRRMRQLGVQTCITDCANWNVRSANGLIRAGFRLYDPATRWGFKDGLYWRIDHQSAKGKK